MDPQICRTLGLLGPATLALSAWWPVRLQPRLTGAALAATLWNLPALLLLHHLNAQASWWSYSIEGGTLHGFPSDLWLGWALLWGALPILALHKAPLWLAILIPILADLIGMPLLQPVVSLHPNWLLGEITGVLLALIPGILLGRWIASRQHLVARSSLLVLGFAALNLWVIPSIILDQTGRSWAPALSRPWLFHASVLPLVFLAAIPGLAAVQEFASRGDGTPLPFDPPRRLVMSGPYAFCSHPMQLSTAAVFLLWGWWSASPWVAAASLAALSTGSGIAGWSESQALLDRFGNTYLDWHRALPRWTPQSSPRIPWPATLYLASSCNLCSQLASWFRRRQPVSLTIAPAESFPGTPLTRMRYEAPGTSASGLEALACALNHLHLSWAWIGWIIRLPIIRPMLQALTDISGGGPRHLTAPQAPHHDTDPPPDVPRG